MTGMDKLVEAVRETQGIAPTSNQEKAMKVEILGETFEYRMRVTAASRVKSSLPLVSRTVAVRINPPGRGDAEWVSRSVEVSADEDDIRQALWRVTAEAVGRAGPYNNWVGPIL